MELHLNIIYHAAKKRGGEWLARVGGRRGWGLAASIGLLMEIYIFCVVERV
jgi:hypothetical protein